MIEHPTINFYPAEPVTLPEIPDGPVTPLGKVEPFALTVNVSPEDFASTMAFLGTRHENPCLAVRWLSDGTSLGVVQFCELEHHTDNLAHRMTDLEGVVTTWRN
jgi:hypothetical protein